MDKPDPGAQHDKEAAPQTPRRRTSAIDGRLPPDVLDMLAARGDLDPEKRADEDEPDDTGPPAAATGG